MNPGETYFQVVSDLLRKIHDNEREHILAAARVIADQIKRDRVVHVIGTGAHSMIGAEEVFLRAGGLVPINPMFDAGLLLLFGGTRSLTIERTPGYLPRLLTYHGLHEGDALIIVNAYGVNSATIDAALEARRLGATTIGVTGQDTADRLPADHPSRHPSGKKLYEFVDVFVNTYVPMGDAAVQVEGVSQHVGPLSTIASSYALNWMVVETVSMLAEEGIDPPIWQSANSPGGDEHNQAYIDKYRGLIKYL